MAKSTDIQPQEMDWIHELAKNELNPEASNIFNAKNQFDPKQILEESTIEFLEDLRELFTAFGTTFNAYSETNTKFSDIKIYGITNTAADFMVFRNNVKLVFSNSAQGIINVSFTQHQRTDAQANSFGIVNPSKQSQDIIAQLGPFLDVYWTYQGEKVNPKRLVKFYFVEFVKASRVPKKGNSTQNQLLLKQIKALLQDQGIDL